MDSEELLRIADDLAAMVGTPGWAALVELVAAEADAHSERAVKVIESVLRSAKPFAAPEPLYRMQGMADGMRAVPAVANAVLTKAEKVRAQLEREKTG
jgi:hypothetical protein